MVVAKVRTYGEALHLTDDGTVIPKKFMKDAGKEGFILRTLLKAPVTKENFLKLRMRKF